MTSNRITDAEFAAALQAGRADAETEIRAQAVRYVADRDAVEIVTTSHAGFLIPRQWIGPGGSRLRMDQGQLGCKAARRVGRGS